jgi:hypothetical protein
MQALFIRAIQEKMFQLPSLPLESFLSFDLLQGRKAPWLGFV